MAGQGENSGRNYLFVDLFHGFGNQLFIYAIGLVTSRRLGLDLCLVYTPFADRPHGGRDYRFLMLGRAADNLLMARRQFAPEIIPKPGKFFETVRDEEIRIEAALRGDVRLPGEFYQDFRPIMPVLGEIREKLCSEFSGENYQRWLDGVERGSSAFLHVRRGDYLELNWHHDPNYYTDALKRLDGCAGVKRIYVISTDMAWCKEQEEKWRLATGKQIEFKMIHNELETFYFMMNCLGGAIISASTFGAWAAMLGANENPASCVIYPRVNPVFDHIVGGMPPNGGNVYHYPERWIIV
jgi:hypothetical protein